MDLLWLLNEACVDEDKSRVRREFITAWRRAHGKLQQSTANVLVGKKAQSIGQMGPGGVPFENHKASRLIAAFFHGDLIHFGKRRDELSLYSDCDFSDANYRMSLFRAMTGLSHIYLGTAAALRSAFPEKEV